MIRGSRGRFLGRIGVVDALILCLLLFLLPAGGYLFKALSRWDPIIDSVAPPSMDAEKGGVLIIYGKNFRRDSRVFLGKKTPLKTAYLPPDRLEAIIPPQKEWGRYDIAVANPTGQMAVLKNAFGLVVKPRIRRIWPARFKARDGAVIQIAGENFDTSCSVAIGHPKMKEVEVVSPTHLLVRVAPREVAPGLHTLSVTNIHGLTASRDEAVESEGCYVVTVVAAVPAEEIGKFTSVWVGPDRWDGREVRILNILKKENAPQREKKEAPPQGTKKGKTGKKGKEPPPPPVTVMANILLPGQEVQFVETEWGKRPFFKGAHLTFGSKLSLQIKGVAVEATVLSNPAPLYAYDPDASFRYD